MRVSKFIRLWRSRLFAISFLRKRRGTVLVLLFFLSSFLPFYLSFFRFRWRTRAGYTFRLAEVKREIRGGIWIESLWKISRSPPRLALLRFTPAGWTSIARNTDPSFPPLSPLIRAHRRRCRCDCFVSRSCPSTDRCPDTFDKSSCTSPRSCAIDCTPSDCCTSSADPIDRKFEGKSNLVLFLTEKKIHIYIGVPDSYIQTVQTCATGATA